MNARSGMFSLLTVLVVSACATAPVGDINPGERPTASSDEAGLWMEMDEMERRLASSGRVVDDPALNEYVRGIVCRLAPAHCSDIRCYIMRTPHFNASMAPNGHMQIWTGLLLRAQNEAQLAYILGHELAHYLKRHSLQRWRTIRNTSSGLVFFQIATGGVGMDSVGDFAPLVATVSLLAYSRHHEREADRLGIDLMARAGYDPHEASKIWEAVIEEEDAAGGSKRIIWLATHPNTEERAKTLTASADSLSGEGQTFKGRDEYVAAMRPFRAEFLRDELRSGSHPTSEVVFENLVEAGDNPAELYFFQGELCRLRGEQGDRDEAIKNYLRALDAGDAPPATYRALGLVYWRTGRIAEARDSLAEYLRVAPDAPDSLMIQSYLDQLE
jgi:predicted Zn-dependent protease